MDEGVLLALARRLTPHLEQQHEPVASFGHLAYTVASLAADLGVSCKTIRCAITRGELRAVKRGARWIIPAEAVLEWTGTPEPQPTRKGRCHTRASKAAGPSLRAAFCGTTPVAGRTL